MIAGLWLLRLFLLLLLLCAITMHTYLLIETSVIFVDDDSRQVGALEHRVLVADD